MDQDSRKARKRAQSRGSTASIHSISTQPNIEQAAFGDASELYGAQWMSNDTKDLDLASAAAQMSPEDMILQAAPHMRASREYSVDPSLGNSAPMGHAMAYQQQLNLPRQRRHPLPGDNFAVNASFTDPVSQMMDRDEHDDGDSVAGPKPAARGSANNELEMRQLFSANKHRKLPEIARELHGNERGPNSERTRQVFAMLWINQVCSKGRGSVPRGRVYANYASRCATERITVLNPASFGKLVRVLFPGLKTRRLGVRGESKYHYVNFILVDDQPDAQEPQDASAIPLPDVSFSQSFNTLPAQTVNSATQNSTLPPPEIDQRPESPVKQLRTHTRSHSLYNQPDVSSVDQLNSSSTKTALKLAFTSDAEDPFQQSEPINVPRIEPFLPHGTDPDAAKSLSALYRSHCTSLVECVRYCREKTFFHLYTSFQGTLTMPVQKLLGNPNVAPWIEECDFILYQRMMRIVSGLTLQVVPKPVLDMLRNISERLVPHIREAFQGQPQHVIRAKEAPATIFAALLDRALRVNLTAHAAANMLSNPANRDQMYLDWITMVRLRKVAECVPTRGMDDLVTVLLSELRGLLDPVNVAWETEVLTIYGDMAARSGRQPDAESSGDSNGQNVLDRWVNFLRRLPSLFPYADHADIVWCVQRVGTAVMRDLTLAQGKSFGSWWVTKCWIDEMVCFMAEQGGFMTQKTTQSSPIATRPQTASKEASRQGSRYSSGSDEFNFSSLSHAAQPDQAPFPPTTNHGHHDTMEMGGGGDHDDSGIGIRTPEEDFPMDKFTFGSADDHGIKADAGLDHSTMTRRELGTERIKY